MYFLLVFTLLSQFIRLYNLSQVFLHFNDGEGPYKDYCKYDGRPMLGLPHDYKDPEKIKKMLKLNDELLKKDGKLK